MDSNARRNKEKQKLAHDAYTVGWICVLPCELNAARALLDEEHEPLLPAEKDDNSYLLGCMTGHNVVIAFTGSGTYGTAAAAHTATHMVRTFHNIRFGLMVGVGGGAPKRPDRNDPLNDVRLGDVVVSTAKGSHGGVLQYDMGKWKNDDEFRIESHLNKSPHILSKAIELLQSHHDFGEGEMIRYIDDVALKSTRRPALRNYRFPGRDKDQLFKSDCRHGDGDDCSACDVAQLENRLSRESDDPMIHYGLIASGNAVMRSAQHRDKLRDMWGVVCFEMEAAGLMDNFPCIVIRGICDYSDDHKHKLWQPYSAVAAAAYAKDLLRVIQVQEVQSMKTAALIIKQVLDTISRIDANIEMMKFGLNRKEDLEILNWLTPADYGPQQSDNIRRRQAGTGQWLLDLAQFKAWVNTSKQSLFCPGIPGAGKTILTSIVVEHLGEQFQKEPTVGIAYIYCNFQRKDEQKLEDLLASLLKQLSGAKHSLPKDVKELYERHSTKRTRPSADEISRTLKSLTGSYSRVFVVVDALDECQVADGCRTRFIEEVLSLQAEFGVNIFMTSRFLPEVIDKFDKICSLEIRATQDDVEKYLEACIRESSPTLQNMREDIKATVSNAVDGMFLLARIYLNLLKSEVKPRKIRSALTGLRRQIKGSGEAQRLEVLRHAYDEAMERINTQEPSRRDFAKQVLSWITCARRPLKTAELQCALTIEPGDSELDKDDLPRIDDVVAVCAGLVTVDKDSGIIRLVHYTTQEYFEQTKINWFTNAESDITSICITYLSFNVFGSGCCATDNDFEERLRSNQLYDYAAHNWGYHACKASALSQEIINFLEHKAKVDASSQALMAFKQYSLDPEYRQQTTTHMTGLHLSPHSKDSYGRTPLSYAAEKGYESVVRLLLEKGACLESREERYGQTPLSWAARDGHESVVRLLLEKGADLESRDKGFGRTPLSWAAEKGHESVVRLLLEKGAYLEHRDMMFGQTPLSLAAEQGHETIVKLLVEKGADRSQIVHSIWPDTASYLF
ncbi:hypothetical protein V8C42DRAFT_360491 [Trichoderma barbatum]